MFKVKSRTARELFANTAQEWVEGARQTARRILEYKPYVNIEDVLEEYPFPEYLNRNIRGQVFKHPDFVHYSYTTAKRPISKGSILHNWRLRKGA
jgi:hypothetical protein